MKASRLGFPSLRADARGAIYFEFLLVTVPLWVAFLCLVQLALLAHANLLVMHASEAAARSASVVLPDDPQEYGGEPVMSVARGSIDAATLVDALETLSRAATDAEAPLAETREVFANVGRSRLNTIRLAAHVPLIPLAPATLLGSRPAQLRTALSSKRSLLGSLYYQPFAVAVTFPRLQGDEALGPEITVQVSYAFACRVPVARRLLCVSFDDLPGRDLFDESFAPVVSKYIPGRFREITHETTLLIHGAPYEYRARERS
ncbi:MAG: hypothetical protein AAF500_16575 [Myxococcota bacterium]